MLNEIPKFQNSILEPLGQENLLVPGHQRLKRTQFHLKSRLSTMSRMATLPSRTGVPRSLHQAEIFRQQRALQQPLFSPVDPQIPLRDHQTMLHYMAFLFHYQHILFTIPVLTLLGLRDLHQQCRSMAKIKFLWKSSAGPLVTFP